MFPFAMKAAFPRAASVFETRRRGTEREREGRRRKTARARERAVADRTTNERLGRRSFPNGSPFLFGNIWQRARNLGSRINFAKADASRDVRLRDMRPGGDGARTPTGPSVASLPIARHDYRARLCEFVFILRCARNDDDGCLGASDNSGTRHGRRPLARETITRSKGARRSADMPKRNIIHRAPARKRALRSPSPPPPRPAKSRTHDEGKSSDARVERRSFREPLY